jgi:hypothetical protein
MQNSGLTSRYMEAIICTRKGEDRNFLKVVFSQLSHSIKLTTIENFDSAHMSAARHTANMNFLLILVDAEKSS